MDIIQEPSDYSRVSEDEDLADLFFKHPTDCRFRSVRWQRESSKSNMSSTVHTYEFPSYPNKMFPLLKFLTIEVEGRILHKHNLEKPKKDEVVSFINTPATSILKGIKIYLNKHLVYSQVRILFKKKKSFSIHCLCIFHFKIAFSLVIANQKRRYTK